MRSHSAIITDAEGPTAFHRKLELGEHQIHAVRSWYQRDSIPPEHWRRISELGLATLEELAEAAEAKKLSDDAAREAAA